MRSTIEELTLKEKQLIAGLYGDKELFNALKKFFKLETSSLGLDALVAPDYETVRYLSGRASMGKDLLALAKELSVKSEKS